MRVKVLWAALCAAIFLSAFVTLASSESQAVVYVTISSHSERNEQFKNRLAYQTRRDSLIRTAQTIESYGAYWNQQSDHPFLAGVLKWDVGSLRNNTNGLNVLQYVRSRGHEADPHAHPDGSYNYADVAKLNEQVTGRRPTVEGGYRIDNTDLAIASSDQTAIRDRAYSWRPEVLSLGAWPNHEECSEAKYSSFSGVIRPTGTGSQFLADNPASSLATLGAGWGGPEGAELVDTTSDLPWTSQSKFVIALAEKIRDGELPPGEMYTADLHFQDAKMQSGNQYDLLAQELEDLAPLVASGEVKYVTMQTLYATWRDEYGSRPNLVRMTQFDEINQWMERNCA